MSNGEVVVPRMLGLRRFGLLAVATAAAAFGGAEVASADYASTVLEDDPASYFRLDETGDATTMVNQIEAPAATDGTHELGPVQGLPGALALEDPNLAISYTDADADRSRFFSDGPYTAFSLEFWMITTQADLPASVEQWYNGAGLVDGEVTGVTSDAGTALIRDGKVGFGVGNPDVTIASASDVNDGEWHHVVATADGAGAMKLYVDGELETQIANGPTGARSNPNFSIGSLDTNVGWFAGGLDEVAFYKHVLSADDVAEHHSEATVQGDVTILVRDYILGGEGTVTASEFGIDCGPVTDACDTVVPFGTEIDFTAVPAPGSRFGEWDDDSGCVPLHATVCNFVADDPGFNDIMVLGSNFYFNPTTLAEEQAETADDAANGLERGLDNLTILKNNGSFDYSALLVSRPVVDHDVDSGGAVVSIVPDGQVSNIENHSGSISPEAPDPNMLIGSDGATLIGSDGATLIGSDGATLIGSDGATRPRAGNRDCAKKTEDDGTLYVIGRWASAVPEGAPLEPRDVSFEFTEEGKDFLETFGKMNQKRKKKGKKPKPLPATYIEAIQPGDELGTGAAFDLFCIEK